MKNILILGVSRSGKTTLTKKILQKYPSYKILDIDAILDAFIKVFPKIDVDYFYNDYIKGKESNNKIAEFIGCFLKEQTNRYKEEDIFYIIEGDSILPEGAKENFDLENAIVLFLGHNKLTIEDILNNCRKYDKYPLDWSTRWADEEVLRHAKWQLCFGKKIERQCIKYGFRFIDTSFNRNEVIDELFKQIEKEIFKI